MMVRADTAPGRQTTVVFRGPGARCVLASRAEAVSVLALAAGIAWNGRNSVLERRPRWGSQGVPTRDRLNVNHEVARLPHHLRRARLMEVCMLCHDVDLITLSKSNPPRVLWVTYPRSDREGLHGLRQFPAAQRRNRPAIQPIRSRSDGPKIRSPIQNGGSQREIAARHADATVLSAHSALNPSYVARYRLHSATTSAAGPDDGPCHAPRSRRLASQ